MIEVTARRGKKGKGRDREERHRENKIVRSETMWPGTSRPLCDPSLRVYNLFGCHAELYSKTLLYTLQYTVVQVQTRCLWFNTPPQHWVLANTVKSQGAHMAEAKDLRKEGRLCLITVREVASERLSEKLGRSEVIVASVQGKRQML